MRTGRRSAGFTMVEALVAVAVIGLFMVVGLPALQNLLQRSKFEGLTRETAILMRAARFESIKRGVPTVVQISPGTREIIAFADVHGANQTDPSDGVFGPIAGATYRTTDYEIGRLRLPGGVSFSFQALTDLASVDGFVNNGAQPPPDQQAVFQTDGSVMAAGAFRFGDSRGNFLEARVEPPATARIEVRKWDDAATAWHAFGEGGQPWNWK
jgi:hypothetical protein